MTIVNYEEKRQRFRMWAKLNYIDPFNLSGRLLDAGCGDGFWCSVFAEFDIDPVGIDYNSDALASGNARWPWLDLRCLTINEASQEDLGHFDVVFCRTANTIYNLPRLNDAAVVTNQLLHMGDRLLLSVYSTQEARWVGNNYMPTRSALLHMVEDAGGKVNKNIVIGNYIQIEAECAT